MASAGFTLQQIAERLGSQATVVGQGGALITGVAPLHSAQAGQISFLATTKSRVLADLASTKASAIVVKDASSAPGFNLIVVPDPVEAFDLILGLFPTPQCPPPAGVDPAARIDPGAELGEGVAVGPGVVVQAGARIGPRTVLWANVFVGADCRIGADCTLHPGVVLREQTELGDRVIIHPNAVLGADGFGYRTDRKTGVHHKVPQVGRVIVGNDVEIGANTTIDRAKFGSTRIGNGAKIDNLCMIAHNVQVGDGCLIAALTGLAGSVELDHHVVLAGHVGIRDNVHLAAGTIVTAMSGCSHDTKPGDVQSGHYGQDHRVYLRQMALTKQLPELFQRVKELADRLEAIERAAADDPKAG
ncbi:MAG: UDP-3-O-(3-hydroxymyristoyl)glucosamine N-acyltransferase [Phycisphaerae bacterium]|nr:UDP-3-O-(3-hydroxymyristoyl)glucosamine N-acyltransferase [Phycisphaerae bacterium]